MNKERRKRIESIIQDIDEVLAEEQEYFDNMPENMQQGEKGERAEEAIRNLEEAVSSLQSAMD